MSNPGEVDLDSILDQALDDFEKGEIASKARKVNDAAKEKDASGSRPTTSTFQEEKKKKQEHQDKMLHLMSQANDPTFGPTLQTTLQSLSNTAEGNERVDELFDNIAKQFSNTMDPTLMGADEVESENLDKADVTVAATLKMLAEAQQGMEGFEASKIEEVGENMMEEMMAQFEELGEKEDYNEVVDGIMRQLLCRDLMYEPMRQICDKFPEWLAIHKPTLTEQEYLNYGLQYQTFQKLLAVYDMEPDNFPRLMELMFDVQKYGQPPGDIIKDLAPGLKFDENGMPVMANMGSGMFPEMPNSGEGLPDLSEVSQKMASGQCTVM
jgi:peroxin-19